VQRDCQEVKIDMTNFRSDRRAKHWEISQNSAASVCMGGGGMEGTDALGGLGRAGDESVYRASR